MKIIKNVLLIISLIFLTLNVKVLEKTKKLEIEYQEGIYYTRRINGVYSSYLFPKYLLDKEVVYCIEPGYQIYNYNYQEGNFKDFNLSDDKKKLLELIGYYGYEYPNHTDVKYLLATQELIWETLGVSNIEFYTERYGYGNLINIDTYKNEIKDLIKKHDLKPNIKDKIKCYLNKELILEDTNNILSEYEIINTKDATIKNNKLIIKTKDKNLKYLILRKKRYDNNKNTLFISLDNKSQKLAKLRYTDDIEFKINIEVLSGEFTLQKLDYDTKSTNVIKNTSLENAKYGIYDLNNNLIKIITTDKLGKCYLNNLELGTYLLKELEPSLGYQLDPTIYKFIIDENNLKVSLEVYEKLIKKQVKVEKIESNSNIKINLAGIKFKILDLTRDIYLDKIYETNAKGEFETDLLPLGEYELIELDQIIPGYKVNLEPLKFEITNKDLNLQFYNERIKGYLKLLKVNKVASTPLEGVIYSIYNLNDELINEVKTDSNGIVEIPLWYGSYYLLEKETLDGYVLDNEKYYFDITNDLEVIEIVLTNEKIEVPNTLLNKNGVILTLSIILLSLSSFFILNYLKNTIK